MPSAENSAKKQRGRPFVKGRSGNPKGKPKGARNKATLAAEVLLDGEAETITRKAIELAKGGDIMAIRLCLERILPPRKDRPIAVDLPAIICAADLKTAYAAVGRDVANGELTPDQERAMSDLLESYPLGRMATGLRDRLGPVGRSCATWKSLVSETKRSGWGSPGLV